MTEKPALPKTEGPARRAPRLWWHNGAAVAALLLLLHALRVAWLTVVEPGTRDNWTFVVLVASLVLAALLGASAWSEKR